MDRLTDSQAMDLPRAMLLVDDHMLRGGDAPQRATVVVDGEPVAQLAITDWKVDGKAGAIPKLTVSLMSVDVLVSTSDGRRPEPLA